MSADEADLPIAQSPPLDDEKKRTRILEDEVLPSDVDSLPVAKKRKLSEEFNAATPTATDVATHAPTVARPPILLPSPDGLPFYFTSDVPMNRQGFRYTPAGPSPPSSILSHRTVESLPSGYVRVSWEDRSPYIRLTHDAIGVLGDKGFRSARLNVPVKEGKWYMEVKITKGGGDGAGPGRLEGAHVRLGWARREAPLNGPAGMDGYSYAYRDKTGDKITLSRPKSYGKSYGSGDVIGLYISLPPRKKPSEKDPNDPALVVRKRIAINYKNQLYFESMDYAPSKEMIALMDFKKQSDAPSKKDASMQDSQMDKTSAASRRRKNKPAPAPDAPALRPLPKLGPESCVAFFVNGECQGTAFTDLYDYLQLQASMKKDVRGRRNVPSHLRERENPFDDGSLGYYPFVSVFNDAQVTVNAGPNFDYPPPENIDALLHPNETQPKGGTPSFGPTWRPLCERYAEYMAEEHSQDELDEQEAQRAAAEAKQLEEAEKAKEDARIVKKQHQDEKKAQEKAASQGKRSRLGSEVVTAEDLLEAAVIGEDQSTPDSNMEAARTAEGPVDSALVLEDATDHVPRDDGGVASSPSASERTSAEPSRRSSRHSSRRSSHTTADYSSSDDDGEEAIADPLNGDLGGKDDDGDLVMSNPTERHFAQPEEIEEEKVQAGSPKGRASEMPKDPELHDDVMQDSAMGDLQDVQNEIETHPLSAPHATPQPEADA